MVIYTGPTPYSPVISTPSPRVSADRVGSPAAARATPMQPVGPQAPNDAERMTRAFDNVLSMLNQQMQANNRNLRFSLDTKLNRPVITITDKNTGDVIRQIPGESMLRVAHSIENLKGVLYNGLA